ncbi:DUF3800 domain-containing protein [Arthrobacter pityocampae]|uniref:DUF3800 domain-containing protein n=1 Tax=Arthrobacter pityocampae TaxID=547334 RepID=UPI0037370A6A
MSLNQASESAVVMLQAGNYWVSGEQGLAYLAYVDESFKSRRFYLGAIMLDTAEAANLTAALDRLSEKWSATYGLPYGVELHGYEIFHGEKSWEPMKLMVRARVGIYKQLIDTVLDHDVLFYFQCIDEVALLERQTRQGYPQKFATSQVAWNFILQKLSAKASYDKTEVLIIADEEADYENRRRALAEYRVSGTPGTYLKSRLPGILDTIHFAPSHHSRLLQAIDCTLFIHQRLSMKTDTDARAIKLMDEWRDQLNNSGKIRFQGTWP